MQQSESTSSTLTVSPAPLAGAASDPASASVPETQATAHQQHRVPRWLERIELFLRVILRMYIGLAICYAPWSHNFWDQNPIFLQFPGLADFARLAQCAVSFPASVSLTLDCVSRRHSPPGWLRYEKQGARNSEPGSESGKVENPKNSGGAPKGCSFCSVCHAPSFPETARRRRLSRLRWRMRIPGF